MTSPYEGAPDLASVLRTLEAMNSQNQAQPPHKPSDIRQIPALQHQQQQDMAAVLSHQPPAVEFRNHAPRFPASLPQKQIDPSTITDWSTGLKCVMKTVATRDSVIKDIRRLIEISHEHEQQWWDGRQALVLKQEARKEGQKKLDDVLKAVGAGAAGPSKPYAEIASEELRTYDLKVYRAQHQMVKEMSAKLKSIGVPFFGTRIELVRSAKDEDSEVKIWDGGVERKMVGEKELVELQRRMIGILEDLCRE